MCPLGWEIVKSEFLLNRKICGGYPQNLEGVYQTPPRFCWMTQTVLWVGQRIGMEGEDTRPHPLRIDFHPLFYLLRSIQLPRVPRRGPRTTLECLYDDFKRFFDIFRVDFQKIPISKTLQK